MFRSRLLLLASVLGIGALASCSFAKHSHEHDISASLDEDGNLVVPYDEALGEAPEEGFVEGRVLVKSAPVLEKELLGDLSACHTEPLYEGSLWHIVNLPHGEDTTKAVSYLRSLVNFDAVDYDYSMTATAEIESVDISGNEYSDRLPYIESQGIGYAWGHQKHQTGSDDLAGGSRDVVIAIIDTGIDYNHLDLRDNIWTNPGEIPNNGIDDDQNGFVDDVRGWDFVGNNNDPIDDNGHGTHVAGIVAARNNNIGTVGVAYNCKVMAVKAANSSGMLNNTNIARAINYAYMNGASVINMSFGGSSITVAVEEALQEAYNQCVLVASAGNNALCNKIKCPEHDPHCGVSYPAALPYVLGVMSCDASGSALSPFTNYDHHPYDSIEYETFACGESVYSSWPNNKIACLSGTSMAAPVVSGIAALLRSAYPDRNAYPSKFINSQICNTGSSLWAGHNFANAYDALTKIPTPHIFDVYNYYAIDSEAYSPLNNGDGFIDAGETVKIGLEFMNRGGKASNVHVQADTIRQGDSDIVDPYITFEASEFDMADIGTYSIGTGGKTYTDDHVSDVENGLLVHVSLDTPNQYNCVINVHVTYKNGLDPNDNTLYRGDTTISITVSRGMRLPSVITEDTTFRADKLYIVAENLTVAANVTVRFEEGCQVQIYDVHADEYDSSDRVIDIKSYGHLLFDGSESHPIVVKPSDQYAEKLFGLSTVNDGLIEFNYCHITNAKAGANSPKLLVNHSVMLDSLYNYVNFSWGLGTCIYNSWITGHYSIGDYGAADLFNNVIDCTPAGSSLHTFKGKTYNNLFVCRPRKGAYYYSSLTLEGRFITNNTIMSVGESFVVKDWPPLKFTATSGTIEVGGNVAMGLYQSHSSEFVIDNVAETGLPRVDLADYEHHNADLVWPYVEDIKLYIDDAEVNSVAKGDVVTVRMTFSTALDTSVPVSLYYGSAEPYADYKVDGDFIDAKTWEGTFTVASLIEGGKQKFRVEGGPKADDAFKMLTNNAENFSFEIDSTKSMSMDLQADPQEDGVHLSWVQDDYETLMGYNVYRSEDKDGNYTKLNSTIIPENENTFLDDNAEPGKTYWYTFTVVFSDLSESIPAGKVTCRTLDTLPPNVYHTPVNQGYLGNNLIISATASDNVGIVSATLYYRTVGESTYKSVSMLRQSDRYVGTIFGSELSLDGLEYYLVFSDGYGETYKGSAESPYSVIIKDSSALSMMGDVDGDGIVSTKDALMLMQAIEGDRILTDDQFQRADLNHSGVLEAVEALRILQYVNGKINTLEM